MWIGSISGRRRIVRLAAEFADNFNVLGGSSESYGDRMKTLNSYCRKTGRDPTEIRRSWHGFVDIKDGDEAIEKTINDLKAMADAGVQDFILGFRDRRDITSLRLFAERVIPVFR